MRFQASELSTYGDVSSLAKSKIGNVSSTQVRTGADLGLFGKRIKDAIQAEVIPSSAKFDPVSKIIDSLIKEGTYQANTKLAPYFGSLKGLATNMGATETAKAITSAAAWYYNNVEKPAKAKAGAPSGKIVGTEIEILATPPEGGAPGGGGGGPIGWIKDHPLAAAGIGAGIVVLVVGVGIWYTDSQAAAEARAAGRVRV